MYIILYTFALYISASGVLFETSDTAARRRTVAPFLRSRSVYFVVVVVKPRKRVIIVVKTAVYSFFFR